MPKLWNNTIEAHRAAVRDAILDTTPALVAEHGMLSVTMSQIAEQTGIGRATLYKYFSDIEAILLAWHERQIKAHLEYLADVRDRASDAGERLAAVLEAYALLSHESHGHHDTELAAFLHRDNHVAQAHQQLCDLIQNLLTEGAETGDLRDDVAPHELASYCLHALSAASGLASKAAVRRLVTVTMAGLHPAGGRAAQPAACEETGPGPVAGGADRHDHRNGVARRHTRPPHGGHSVKLSPSGPQRKKPPD